MLGGVLLAQKVEFVDSDDDDGDSKEDKIKLHGSITSVDLLHQSFVLRGSTVVYDANTKFDRGDALDLAIGAEVDVKGALSGDGTQVLASKIKFGKE
jgi:hypothetical protein